jgi:uncharacterized membrane protein YphA (DoxX/SURF4 family)
VQFPALGCEFVGRRGSVRVLSARCVSVTGRLIESAKVIGYQTRTTALVLAAWSVATALVAHTHFSDPNQMINFLKNLAMAGGFLQLFAFGGGAWSVDASRGLR